MTINGVSANMEFTALMTVRVTFKAQCRSREHSAWKVFDCVVIVGIEARGTIRKLGKVIIVKAGRTRAQRGTTTRMSAEWHGTIQVRYVIRFFFGVVASLSNSLLFCVSHTLVPNGQPMMIIIFRLTRFHKVLIRNGYAAVRFGVFYCCF